MVRNDQRSSFEAKEHHGHQTVGIRRFSSLQRAGPRSDACPHHRRRDRRDIPSRRTLRNRRNHDPAPADPRPADPQPDRRHHLPVHGARAGIRLDEAGPNGTRPHAQPHRGARLRRRDRGIPAFGHRIVPRADPGRAQCRAVHARQRRAIPRRRRQSVPLGLFVGRSGRAARGGRACRRPYRHGRHVAVAGAERRRRVGCDAGRDRLFRRGQRSDGRRLPLHRRPSSGHQSGRHDDGARRPARSAGSARGDDRGILSDAGTGAAAGADLPRHQGSAGQRAAEREPVSATAGRRQVGRTYLLEGADHGGAEFWTDGMCRVATDFMRSNCAR